MVCKYPIIRRIRYQSGENDLSRCLNCIIWGWKGRKGWAVGVELAISPIRSPGQLKLACLRNKRDGTRQRQLIPYYEIAGYLHHTDVAHLCLGLPAFCSLFQRHSLFLLRWLRTAVAQVAFYSRLLAGWLFVFSGTSSRLLTPILGWRWERSMQSSWSRCMRPVITSRRSLMDAAGTRVD